MTPLLRFETADWIEGLWLISYAGIVMMTTLVNEGSIRICSL